jgi:integrase
MSSLHRDPRGRSPFWYCAYRRADGRRAFKSTERTDKKEAWKFCQALEHSEEIASGSDATRDRLVSLFNDTLDRLGLEKIPTLTVRQWFSRWLKTEEGAVSEGTLERYRQVTRDFLGSLGKRADVRLEAITADDCVRFRDELLAGGRTPGTVNFIVRKVLKRPFKIAIDQGFITRNPIASVRQLRSLSVERGTFSVEQVAKLVQAAEGDWKGLITAAFYTGGRLSDLARLNWSNVDLSEHAITFVQKKTDAKVKIPIHPCLEEYLLSKSSSDSVKAPVFPTLHDKPGSGKSGLSMAFKRIMDRAGIAAGVLRERQGEAGRSLSALSFHGLRHSFNQELKRAGVPQEDRMRLTGHSSEAMNTVYTHEDLAGLYNHILKVPQLPKVEGGPR